MKTNFLGMIVGVVLVATGLVGCEYQKGSLVPATEAAGEEVSKTEHINGLEEEKAVIERILQEVKDQAQAEREEYAKRLDEITQELKALKDLKEDEPVLPCGNEGPEATPPPSPLPSPAPAPTPAPPVVEKGTPAGEPIKVTEVTPSQGAAEVSRTPTIQVVFSKPVDESTMNSNSFYLVSKGVTANKIQGKVQKVSDTTYTLSSIELESWTEYIGVVTKDVKATSGETLWSAYSWSFTTEMPAIPLPTIGSPF